MPLNWSDAASAEAAALTADAEESDAPRPARPAANPAGFEADIAACAALIKTGSHSFYAASRLLPARVRRPAFALYAFCRLADDAVDLAPAPDRSRALERLSARLDRAYAGCPENRAADRAFAAAVDYFDMPKALPAALLDGFAWDLAGRRYATLSDLRAYGARVAGSVGVMMSVIMGVRSAPALARACDLGVAMQLTNIARDVGEDARAGRLYLPEQTMRAAGLDPDAWLARPAHSAALARVVSELLDEADRLYARAEAGIAALPADCRAAIFAARFIYAEIGREVARAGYDSVTRRARTTTGAKLRLLARAAAAAASGRGRAARAALAAPALAETAYLVAAAARPEPARERAVAPSAAPGSQLDRVLDLFVRLAQDDAARRAAAEHAIRDAVRRPDGAVSG